MSEKQKPKVRLPAGLPKRVNLHAAEVGRRKMSLKRALMRWLRETHGDSLKGDEPEPDEESVSPLDSAETIAPPRVSIDDPARRGMPQAYLEGLSDIDFRILTILAHTDQVAARWEIQARHTGELCGVSATDRVVDFSGMTTVTFEGDTAIEEWTYWDLPKMMEQIGATP